MSEIESVPDINTMAYRCAYPCVKTVPVDPLDKSVGGQNNLTLLEIHLNTNKLDFLIIMRIRAPARIVI